MAVLIGEAHLVVSAGVGSLTAPDRPDALRPARSGKIQVRKLSDPSATAGPTIVVQGRREGLLWEVQDRVADPLITVEPDREPQLASDQILDEGMGRAGGVGSDQDRLAAGRLGQRQQRHRQHLQVIGGGVGGGVASS